jgi:hypothetical protein
VNTDGSHAATGALRRVRLLAAGAEGAADRLADGSDLAM